MTNGKGEGGKGGPERRDMGAGQRLEVAQHAMQSGVAMELRLDQRDKGGDWHDHSHKHLRVGVNSALCEVAVCARLLIAKGIITQEEYAEALAQQMEDEKATYEKMLKARTGSEIKLV